MIHAVLHERGDTVGVAVVEGMKAGEHAQVHNIKTKRW